MNVRDVGGQCRVGSLLIADREKCLQRMVNVMGVVCGRRQLKVHVCKSKDLYESV